MKKLFLKTLIGSLLIAGASYAEEFKPNGSLEFTQTFYGNAGKYKTATSHPMALFSYNFAPDWNFALQWDRTWNMYDYNNHSTDPNYDNTHQNNSFSKPQATLSYNHGVLNGTDVKWTSSLNVELENEFEGSHQTYIFAQTAFDFADYIPKTDFISANQFAISPMYIYGWNTKGPSGHYNAGVLSLLTNWQLPADFTFTFNAYGFKEWYNGADKIAGEDREYDDATYFMIMAWLEYSKDIYKFNDQTTLAFNFAGGLDPYITSNRKANWNPFLVGNQMYEWLGPTVDQGNYKKSVIAFALPQLTLTYQYTEDLSFDVFAGVKYSNQVWGSTEKDWKLQPQGGVSVAYNF